MNRLEKIKFLNGLQKGTASIKDIIQPPIEIWEKDSSGYNDGAIHLTFNEIEKKMKVRNKTIIATHDHQTVIIF